MKHEIPKTDGKLEGWVRLYWRNGQIKRETFYKNHQRHGLERLWNQKGVLIDEGSYYKGVPIGLHRQWYEDGTLREKTFYFGPKHQTKKRYNRRGEYVQQL